MLALTVSKFVPMLQILILPTVSLAAEKNVQGCVVTYGHRGLKL